MQEWSVMTTVKRRLGVKYWTPQTLKGRGRGGMIKPENRGVGGELGEKGIK